MNNEFDQLLEQFSDQWETVVQSESLDDVESNFTTLEGLRVGIFDWVFENIESDDDRIPYIDTFGDLESECLDTFGDIPAFDDEFNIFDSFEDYEGYYQRYGCMTPDYIVSWDSESILFMDDDGTICTVKRPDVLMENAE